MKPFISVIIPCYNELANLKRGVLGELAKYLKSQSYSWEVVISDDGSTDGSLAFITNFASQHPQFHLLKNPHAGKPFAIRSGVNHARGEYLLITDMDQSTPITELGKLLPAVQAGFAVVIGSRSFRRKNSSPIRQLASIIFPLIRRAILLPRIKDTQCGFKLIKAEVARRIFSRMLIFDRETTAQGWKVTAYDVEMLYLARKLGINIREIRVKWQDEDTSVEKKRNFIKESLEMLVEIARVKLGDLTGKYARV